MDRQLSEIQFSSSITDKGLVDTAEETCAHAFSMLAKKWHSEMYGLG